MSSNNKMLRSKGVGISEGVAVSRKAPLCKGCAERQWRSGLRTTEPGGETGSRRLTGGLSKQQYSLYSWQHRKVQNGGLL